MHLICVLAKYAEFEQDKLCNFYDNMDYYTVSVKTTEVLIVEAFCSAALNRSLYSAHEFCE